jgi:hypothetical protein
MSARKLAVDDLSSDPLELVRRALVGLRYGECVIAVHDGAIVQVARTEKLRPAKHRP